MLDTLLDIFDDTLDIAIANKLSTLLAFFVTIFLIFFLRKVATRFGLIDHPNNRKLHAVSTPVIGGIAMYIGFAFATVSLNQSISDYRFFFVASGILLLVGILDDMHEIGHKEKFSAQIIVVLIMIFGGDVYVNWVGPIMPLPNFFLGIWAIPFTFVASIALINAFNMSDGLDGLASGYALSALVPMFLLSVPHDVVEHVNVLYLLVLSVFAFFILNFRSVCIRRALVFMGDSGSLFLGFSVLWFAIVFSQHEYRSFNPVTALWFVALPLFDMVAVTVNRLIGKGSPFKADRTHIHHLLLECGISEQRVSYILVSTSIFCSFIGAFGYYINAADSHMFYLFFIFFFIFIAIGKYLRHRVAT